MIALLFALLIAITHPFECVPELGLDDIEARSIWVGYENGGWDIPADIQHIAPVWEDEYTLWFRYSPSSDEYYVWVFNTEPTYSWSEYEQKWGWWIHDCGSGAITPEQFDEIMERVWGETVE